MTRTEAKLVAEELYKLMRKDIKGVISNAVEKETDVWMNAHEVAAYMGVSLGYVMRSDIPHAKIGRMNRYRKSDIEKIMNR